MSVKNAGKSTFERETSSDGAPSKKMFATLDPRRGDSLPREQEIIINDTVGFIRDLPPGLLRIPGHAGRNRR